jgi:hypothetical protein
VRYGPHTDEQGDRAFSAAVPKRVNDKCGPRCIVDIQASLVTLHFDFHLRPLTGHQINISLVFPRKFLAQSIPRKLWTGDVLSRVVALQLVVGTSVVGAQVESLKGWPIRRDSKGDTDKSACDFGGTRESLASYINSNWLPVTTTNLPSSEVPAGAASVTRRAMRPLYVTGSTLAFTGFNPSAESSGTVIDLVCAPLGAQSKTANAVVRDRTRDERCNFKKTTWTCAVCSFCISFHF